MNGATAVASSNSQVSPPIPTSQAVHPSFPATHPEFSNFKFKNLGQPPTLLSRLVDASAVPDYLSPPPDGSDPDMDMASPEDHPMILSDEQHRLSQPTPRKSLLDMLVDHGFNIQNIMNPTQGSEASEPIIPPPLPTSPTKRVFPRPESRTSSIVRQLSGAADAPRPDPASSGASVPPEIHTLDPPDSDMVDLYDDPDSPSRSPLSLFEDLSEIVRESADLDRITTLHRSLNAEREELIRRHEETTRALSRTKSQLDHVLKLTDEAIQITTIFVDKEKSRLETKKTKAETKIAHRKNLEAEQRRKSKELERIRQKEEERKAQVEMEQQAERQRLEEQRKNEEALAAERQRLGEIQAKESAQAEERRRSEEERNRIEEEERRRRLAEEDRRRRDEEERNRQAEELKKEEEERLRRKLAEEKETTARKQEEDRRTHLVERLRLAENDRKRKEAEAIAAKIAAEKQAAEEEQQRIFQERRATVLRDKYKNYNRPESGPSSTGSSSTLEGSQSSNLPTIFVNDVPRNPQISEHSPGLAKANRVPTFVPAATEAGRLPPDLSRQVVSDSDSVKYETTSPVITPVYNAESAESTSPTPLPSRPVSSMSTTAPPPAPATLPAAPHLPTRPTTIYSQPPPIGRYRRSPSSSRSRSPPPRSQATWRSPERGHYSLPTMRNGDHYSPPPSPRYDNRNVSNPRKRTFHDPWDRADTPSKLDYSHPTKRRAASPLRSRSPPSPPLRPPTQPPHVVSTRRPIQINRRGKGTLPLEQRLSSRPQDLAERIN